MSDTMWAESKLGQVVERIVGGGTPPREQKEFYSGPIPWMTVKDLKGLSPLDTEEHISEAAIKASATNLIPPETVIVATRIAVGKVVKVPYATAINQDLKAIYLPSFIDSEYFLYWWIHKAPQIEAMGSGTTVKGIRLEIVNNLEFRYPPHSIQKQIVSKIKTLFSEIDAGVEELKRTKEKLELYKQSVLNAADTGAEVILETVLEKQRGIFDGPFGSHLKSSDYTDRGIRVIRLENIGSLEFIDEHTYVSQDKYDSIRNHTVKAGDLVFSSFVAGEIRTCIIPSHITIAINKADCFCIRPDTSRLLTKFLMYQIASRRFYNALISSVRGVTRPRVNTKILRRTMVRVPDIEKQKNIVTYIDSQFEYMSALQAQINDVDERSTTMRRSILKSAFEGSLL